MLIGYETQGLYAIILYLLGLDHEEASLSVWPEGQLLWTTGSSARQA